MSTNETSGSFPRLRGELCNFTDITGVKSLVTKTGTDLVNVAEGLHEQLTQFQKLLNDLVDRIKKLEAGGVGSATAVAGPAGPVGPVGPKGENGVDGRDGLAGPRGPRGTAEKLRDIGDVDLTGLCDGALLVYKESESKWVVAVSED